MTPTPAARNTRRRGLSLIAGAALLGAVAWGGWHFMHSRYVESTDNAYVAGNVVQITSQVGGTVVAIGADETDFVRAGQPLVRLDTADMRVALEQADAQLAQTVRDVRQLYANSAALQAQLKLRQADAERARADLQRAEADAQRRQPLAQAGAIGKEEFQHAQSQLSAARSALQAAQAAVQAAREQWAASQAQIDGTSVQQHPQVQRAAANVQQAYLALQRATLAAPLAGHIAKRGVQVGQRIAAGSPLLTLVALDQLWVDANFKESQLQKLRIGQSATLQADVYGERVTYHGSVVGLGAGTGAAFALLPAQNATGNWIKVVQRVPVRIALDPQELAAHPLRVGLSMEVNIDTRAQDGKALADAPRSAPVASTPIFDDQLQDADVYVQRIIQSHLGRAQQASGATKS